MTAPGNDCPECDRRIRSDGTCVCGWAPIREDPEAPKRPTCASCREPHPSRHLSPGRDGLERCGPCHITHLRATAADPNDPEVRKCQAELQRILDQSLVKWGSRR